MGLEWTRGMWVCLVEEGAYRLCQEPCHFRNCSPQLLSPQGSVHPFSHPTTALTAPSLK